jgi:dolichyl-phosphate beta-glucosyltransferase
MDVAFIIPCYNEEFRFNKEEFDRFVKIAPFDFYFVNDGSTDKTNNVLQNFCELNSKNCFLLSLKNNLGKAGAVRYGVNTAFKKGNYKHIGFFDADLATPPDEIIRFWEFVKLQNTLLIFFGSRIKRLGSKISRSEKRHYLGRFFATAVSIVSKSDVYDSQCGTKLFHYSTIEVLFGEDFVSKWFFDIEILIRFKRISKSLSLAYEFPLSEWNEKGGSKLKIKDFIKTPLELLKIHNHYKKMNLN